MLIVWFAEDVCHKENFKKIVIFRICLKGIGFYISAVVVFSFARICGIIFNIVANFPPCS